MADLLGRAELGDIQHIKPGMVSDLEFRCRESAVIIVSDLFFFCLSDGGAGVGKALSHVRKELFHIRILTWGWSGLDSHPRILT